MNPELFKLYLNTTNICKKELLEKNDFQIQELRKQNGFSILVVGYQNKSYQDPNEKCVIVTIHFSDQNTDLEVVMSYYYYQKSAVIDEKYLYESAHNNPKELFQYLNRSLLSRKLFTDSSCLIFQELFNDILLDLI